MVDSILPYSNVTQRNYQTWNSDAHQYLKQNVVQLTSLLTTDWNDDNEFNSPGFSAFSLFALSDSTFMLRGNLQNAVSFVAGEIKLVANLSSIFTEEVENVIDIKVAGDLNGNPPTTSTFYSGVFQASTKELFVQALDLAIPQGFFFFFKMHIFPVSVQVRPFGITP